RIAVQLALVNGGLLVRVQEFDGIFDGQDVVSAGFIDQVNDGRQGGGLSRPGWSGDQHNPVLQRRDRLQRSGKVQVGNGRNLRRNHPHYDRVGSPLPEDVYPETRVLRQAVGQIAGALVFERL